MEETNWGQRGTEGGNQHTSRPALSFQQGKIKINPTLKLITCQCAVLLYFFTFK